MTISYIDIVAFFTIAIVATLIVRALSPQRRVVSKMMKAWDKTTPEKTYPEIYKQMEDILDVYPDGTMIGLTIDKDGLPVFITVTELHTGQISISNGKESWLKDTNKDLFKNSYKMLWAFLHETSKKQGNVLMSTIVRNSL